MKAYREKYVDYREKVLADTNRETVTLGISIAFFLTLTLLGASGIPLYQSVMESSSAIKSLFQILASSIITGVTIVVTINQLVLSQELGSLGDQKSRMEGSMKFRRDAEDLLGGVSPSKPESFLRELIISVEEIAEKLQEIAREENIDDLQALAEDIVESSREVKNELEEEEFGSYDVVKAALGYNYNWQLHWTRSLHKEGGDLGGQTEQQLEKLEDTLELFGPAREHFKTLYFQWELITLSRRIIYLAIPSLLVAVSMVFLNPDSFSSQILGVNGLLLVVSAAVTISVSPFFLLSSYILRIGTVAKRTLAIGPFILQEEERYQPEETR